MLGIEFMFLGEGLGGGHSTDVGDFRVSDSRVFQTKLEHVLLYANDDSSS